jgi:hypothetical protein
MAGRTQRPAIFYVEPFLGGGREQFDVVRMEKPSALPALLTGEVIPLLDGARPRFVFLARADLGMLGGDPSLPLVVRGASVSPGELAGIRHASLCENLNAGAFGAGLAQFGAGTVGFLCTGATLSLPCREAVGPLPPFLATGAAGDESPVVLGRLGAGLALTLPVGEAEAVLEVLLTTSRTGDGNLSWLHICLFAIWQANTCTNFVRMTADV